MDPSELAKPGEGAAADAAAAELREYVVGVATPGARLGSVADLASELEVSPPTLRQALRMLQNEGLLVVRRGRHGGIYTGPPNVTAISRAMDTYVRIERIPLLELVQTCTGLVREVWKLAATNASPVERDSLVMNLSKPLEGLGPGDILSRQQALTAQVCEVGGNASLTLFVDLIHDLVSRTLDRNLYEDPALVAIQQRTNFAVAQALANHDPDAIGRIATRQEESVVAVALGGG